jgi:hypothetical protein
VWKCDAGMNLIISIRVKGLINCGYVITDINGFCLSYFIMCFGIN